MEYYKRIVKVAPDNGEEKTIVEELISADEVVDILTTNNNDDEEEEPAPTPKPKKKTIAPKKRQMKCSKCGETGHNAKTCSGPKDVGPDFEEPARPKRTELTEDEKIDNMAKAGTSVVEMQMAFPNVPAWKLRDAYDRFNS